MKYFTPKRIERINKYRSIPDKYWTTLQSIANQMQCTHQNVSQFLFKNKEHLKDKIQLLQDSPKGHGSKPVIDLSNKIFGNVLVINQCKERGSRAYSYWNCKCSCGNKLILRSDVIRKAKYNPCPYCRSLSNFS